MTRRAAASFKRADKEKKPAQLIVAALPIIAVKGLNNENILAANANQRPRLMLAILALAFLMRARINGKPSAHLFTKRCDCCSAQRALTGRLSPKSEMLLPQ